MPWKRLMPRWHGGRHHRSSPRIQVHREPQRQPLDINALVIEVVKLAQSDDEHRALTCELRLARDLPLVFADRIMIEQVLLNFPAQRPRSRGHTASGAGQRIARFAHTGRRQPCHGGGG